MSENKTTNNKEVDDLDIEAKTEEEGKEQTKNDEENVIVPKSKIILVKKLITNIKENNDQLLQLLSAFLTKEEEERIGIAQISDENFASKNGEVENLVGGRIIEGVFDGEGMVGPDGKQYSIPANYASKSRLVEGDIMKLTITANGTFVYKQIGPIERVRLVGNLEQGTNGNYVVKVDNKQWKVLTASVTYYKGQVGDEAVILVPKSGDSAWAAVENIVRKNILE